MIPANLNPDEMSRQELEDLYEAAVHDREVFRFVARERPDLWAALQPIARERKRAGHGKWHRIIWPFEWVFIWLLRIVTAPFKGYV